MPARLRATRASRRAHVHRRQGRRHGRLARRDVPWGQVPALCSALHPHTVVYCPCALGVEVTQAISQETQEADALYAKLRETDDAKLKERLTERIEQVGAEVFDWGLFGPSGKDSLGLIIEAYKEKLGKLNGGGYRPFAHNHLFIRSDVLADTVMLEEALAAFLSLSVYSVSFERVIVTVPGHNYDFDLVSQMYKAISFGSDDQFRIAEQARALVLGAEMS